jgi:hypothetical protein
MGRLDARLLKCSNCQLAQSRLSLPSVAVPIAFRDWQLLGVKREFQGGLECLFMTHLFRSFSLQSVDRRLLLL